MAGNPRKREREAAERRSGKRFDRAAREAILQRAEEVGSAAAAAEVKVAEGTIRTWRKRLNDSPIQVAITEAPAERGEAQVDASVQGLRSEAARARASSVKALDAAERMVASSRASDARNASVVAGVFAERARELEQAAQVQEKHENALAEERAQQAVRLIERGWRELGFPVPTAFLAGLLEGESKPEDCQQARQRVTRLIREQVRVEVMQELLKEGWSQPEEASQPDLVAA